MDPDFIVGTVIPNYLSATVAAGGLVVAIVSLVAARASRREAALARAESAAAQARSEEMDAKELELRAVTAGAISALARWTEQREAAEKTPDDSFLVTVPYVAPKGKSTHGVYPWDKDWVNQKYSLDSPIDLGPLGSGIPSRNIAGDPTSTEVPLSTILDGYASRLTDRGHG